MIRKYKAKTSKRKKIFERQKGITLIALVITIIVMLILAGVSLNMTLGDNGILTQALRAKEAMEEAQQQEQMEFKYTESIMLPEWSGEVAEGFASGTGTEDDPFIIENGEQLAYFASVVNGVKTIEGVPSTFEGKYVSIVKSINLGNNEFTPIGSGADGNAGYTNIWNTENYFNGTLKGNNNVIANMQIGLPEKYGVGLIGCLGEAGVVENVYTYESSIIGGAAVGGIVGQSKGIIRGCVNKSDIIAQDDTTKSYTGELAGGIVGTIAGGKIENCKNYGNVITKDESMKTGRGKCAGGIVGYIFNTTEELTIENCANYGNVTSQYSCTGGIVGSTEYNSNKLILKNCTNSGKIEAKAVKEDLTGTGLEGKVIGVCGGIIGWGYSETEIEGCNNSGQVTANNQQAGGIAGEVSAKTSITNCSNSGEIKTLASNFAGGIVGLIKSETEIEGCNNSGQVTAYNQQAGGIVGKIDTATGKTMITNCSNNGEIKTLNSHLAGGIVGCISTETEISGCNNSGKVTASRQSAGGIVGKVESTSGKTTITNCSNKGEIKTLTSNFAGGIVGLIKSETEIEGCSNSAPITAGGQAAAGIAGRIDVGIITNCYNTAEILSQAQGTTKGISGGIVGTFDNVTMTNVYNSGKVSTINNESKVDTSGGLIGLMKGGTITNAYNKGTVEGEVPGGLVGQKTGGSLEKTYYYTDVDTLKGIGSSSTSETIEVDDVPGQFEPTTKILNSLAEFLSATML